MMGSEQKITLSYKFEKPYISSDSTTDTENYLLLELRPKVGAVSENLTVKGVDFCVVLDVSGSMREPFEGNVTKVKAAVEAAKHLYSFLTPEDTVSIVLYDSAPYVVLERAKPTKAEFENALEKAYLYGGSTNISAALRKAREILSKNTGNLKKIVFLTDGLPTDDTEQDGLREGKLIAEEKISITALGIGNDFNYKFIEELVKPSRGTTDWLKSPSEALKIFQRTFQRTKSTVITNVNLELEFSDKVRVGEYYRVVPETTYYGKPEFKGDRKVELPLDNIEYNRYYQYLFQITIPPLKTKFEGPFRVAKARLTYFVPAENRAYKIEEDLIVEFTSDKDLVTSRYSTVSDLVSRCQLNKLDTKLNEAIKANDKKAIVGILQELSARAYELNDYELANHYEKMRDDLLKKGVISNEMLIKASNSSTKVNGEGLIEEVEDISKVLNDVFGS
ncbi:vWA domain-containing protein [Fervidobacterium thailandense]|uniref:VWFA domain-containing protein n=1 Tax=Fervidobacterium thailandense TaxID=1008305 RepID=A0A1E3G3D8_9BACT|nr:vWA domain-containing protein [Fervidobacterium thailandense]ODN30767.1 hypothetical protein A4H02_04370 [Fervidobacterium thailandense]